jgi:MerR family transcriptional regulator/heat shock protein HspR
MTQRIIPRDRVARELGVSPSVLIRYESAGLVCAVHQGTEEGYEPTQIRRLWSIVSFQRDLGVNLAGVEVILRLSDQLTEMHRCVGRLAGELRELVESDDFNSAAEAHD